MARTFLSLAVLSLLASCNCELVACMRHSDCPHDMVCAAGVCGAPLVADTDTDTDAFLPPGGTESEGTGSASTSGDASTSSDTSTTGDASSTGEDPSGTTTGPGPVGTTGEDAGTTGLVETETDTDTDTSDLPLSRTPQWP